MFSQDIYKIFQIICGKSKVFNKVMRLQEIFHYFVYYILVHSKLHSFWNFATTITASQQDC